MHGAIHVSAKQTLYYCAWYGACDACDLFACTNKKECGFHAHAYKHTHNFHTEEKNQSKH